ncbi:MAG: hypothetical protein K5978_04520 [Campylobacter sp.]|nr:hypothetical protein [Campylobacter sp.]
MTNQRAKLLAELFGDNKGYLPQAKLLKLDKKLFFIKDDELIDFAIFCDRYMSNFVSKDAAIHKACVAWQRNFITHNAKPGARFFKNKDLMIEFIKEAFKNDELCSCGKGSGFINSVIILVDEFGNLRNKFRVNDNGVYTRLDANDEAMIFSWLFENQHKIGDCKITQEIKELTCDESPKLQESNFKNVKTKDEALAMIGKLSVCKRLKK